MRGGTVSSLLFVGMFLIANVAIATPQPDLHVSVPGEQGAEEPETIQPDVVYERTAVFGSEVYHLVADAGQVFRGWSHGNLGCYSLLDEDQDPFDETACSYQHGLNTGPVVIELPYTGDYYFRIAHLSPAVFKFGFSLTQEAPDVRTLPVGPQDAHHESEPLSIPEGCHGEYEDVPGTFGPIPGFTDDCYHMRTDLNHLSSPNIDILIVPPVSPFPERDLRIMRQAVQMWVDGIHELAPQMGLDWLDEGVDFQIFIDDDELQSDPLWDPDIVVVATNPVGGAGIGVDPFYAVFGTQGSCHNIPDPIPPFDAWLELPGFDSHHDKTGGTFMQECENSGSICYAVNGAVDPAPDVINVFNLYDLVAHELGHCLTIGHVGDALDHKANAVPYADIMSYTNQPHFKCVSSLDVQAFALTMSRHLLVTPLKANDHNSTARGSFQIQHPDDHQYASPTGLPADCPQPDVGVLPCDGATKDVCEHGSPGSHWPFKQNDADSGHDAPDEPRSEVWIESGVVYEGTSGFLDGDHYAFHAEEGQVVQVKVRAQYAPFHIVNEDGDWLDSGFSGLGKDLLLPQGVPNEGLFWALYPDTIEYTVEETTIHYLRVTGPHPQQYSFSIGINEPTPEPGFLGNPLPPLPPLPSGPTLTSLE